ncbi:MAG: SDR family NAD(P)-dependent oxidoreductase [Actinomycetota bacterium]
MKELFSLEGKRALVTGASAGIGRAIAIAYAEAGADVAVVARRENLLAEAVGEIEAKGRRGLAIRGDVTVSEDVDRAVSETVEGLGGIDILVNNAGGSPFHGPITAWRESGFDKVVALNLKSTFLFCKAAGPHLLSGGSGSVINLVSVAGLRSTPYFYPYGAAKAGIANLTKSLAVEWAPAGVRVNAIAPGWTLTELTAWADEQAKAEMAKTIPMGRWARPEEMAYAAVFLASAAASYITGQVLAVDGGVLA